MTCNVLPKVHFPLGTLKNKFQTPFRSAIYLFKSYLHGFLQMILLFCSQVYSTPLESKHLESFEKPKTSDAWESPKSCKSVFCIGNRIHT